MARARQAAHNAPAVIPPQGRLTLTTATPVMTADAANQTTIYYTPYVGDRVPLYNGTEWENKLFTELSIAMAASANWAANSNFDVFVYNDAGTLRLVTGAAWTNDTTRAEALVRTNGIWLNNASFTGRYGASSTVSISASRATYVGTIRTTSSAGTTTWELGGAAAGGDPGLLYVWNCYNRAKARVANRDSTDSWSYGTAAYRSLNNSTSNRVSFVRGLNEDVVTALMSYGMLSPSGASIVIGFGIDSTTTQESLSVTGFANGYPAYATGFAIYSGVPSAGFHYLQAIEYSQAASATLLGDGGTTFSQFGIAFDGMF